MAPIHALFEDIRNVGGVEAIVLMGDDGRMLYTDFQTKVSENLGAVDGKALARVLAGLKEAELIFEHYRIYGKRAADRWLLVLMTAEAPVAMVRINCDVIAPALAETVRKPKGLGRFFKRKTR